MPPQGYSAAGSNRRILIIPRRSQHSPRLRIYWCVLRVSYGTTAVVVIPRPVNVIVSRVTLRRGQEITDALRKVFGGPERQEVPLVLTCSLAVFVWAKSVLRPTQNLASTPPYYKAKAVSNTDFDSNRGPAPNGRRPNTWAPLCGVAFRTSCCTTVVVRIPRLFAAIVNNVTLSREQVLTDTWNVRRV